MKNEFKKIKVVFKTHLDIGFTDSAAAVTRSNLEKDIPQALRTAEYFRLHEHNGFRYCWTVGSWLIHESLERSDAGGRKKLEQAIQRGDITWHALPFSTHSEFAGESLFRYGVSLSQKLDRQFGRTTIGAKMTDVPGHTRGIIRPLAEAGVKLLHIGINPASALVSVPPIFRWRDQAGNIIIVVYQPDYGTLLSVPGMNMAYRVVVGGDNTGAQSPESVVRLLKELNEEYPEAEIIGTTFNEMAADLVQLDVELPILNSEIGDTWIHGIGTDPWKVARFRELCRFRTEEMPAGQKYGEYNDLFSRNLLLVAEHTWGLDEKTHFHNRTAWKAAEVAAIAEEAETKRFAASWQEQRDYLFSAIAFLPPALAATAKERLDALIPIPLSHTGLASASFDTRNFLLEIDLRRGCVSRLYDKCLKREFASSARPLFIFTLQSLNAADIERFKAEYLRCQPGWARADFGKPGMPETLPRQTTTGFPCQASGEYRNGSWHIKIDGQYPAGKIGGFEQVTLELELPDRQPEIHAKLQWFGKSADRQPHMVWFGFHPTIDIEFCRFSKLGELIDACDVLSGGGRALHAIDGEIRWGNQQSSLLLNSLDAPLLAPGKKSIGNFTDALPELNEGVSINLYNNLWGTNFPMWFGDDMLFRFKLCIQCDIPPQTGCIE